MNTVEPDHSLRTASLCTLTLLIGFGLGWYVAHKKGKRDLAEAVELAVDGVKSSDRHIAAFSVRAINQITSGDTNAAIRPLSHPVENYYTLYKRSPDKDERDSKLDAAIDDLIRTNHIAADAIHEITERNK